jgi:uncharacterized protein (DUF1810 family)
MSTPDPFNLERFVAAQSRAHDTAVAELRNGCKQSHWMWFVFPQLAGLGHSARARLYGITSLDEAQAYLAHPVLGPRLLECAGVLEGLDQSHSASSIFGYPDDLKLRSSLTLFARAAGSGSIFGRMLDKYFAGEPDDRTVALLQLQGRS